MKKIFVKVDEDIIKKILKRGSTLVVATAITMTLSGCNREIIDTKYGLDTGLTIGDDTAIIFEIENWKDYEGEQYQLKTPQGLVMLSSSFDTELFYGHSDTYSVKSFASNAISNLGELHYLGLISDKDKRFNYQIIDTHWKYNKAAIFNKNKALVANIVKWRSYQGEQFQIVTEDGMVMLPSSYNAKLFYDLQSPIKAEDFAKKYVGSDGQVHVYGEEISVGNFNYDILDLNYVFNKIIIFKDETAVVLPIDNWTDYEGEQLQVSVHNGPLLLTAAYDSILINDTKSQNKAITIAKMLSDNFFDYSLGFPDTKGFLNKVLLDLEYGFNNAIISNNNSATAISIDKWCDYKGEQLQITLPTGDVILTSSLFLDLLNGGSEKINASTLACDYATGKVIDKAQNVTNKALFNCQILDLNYKFKYALKLINGNVTILPLYRWKDYYNSNGYKSAHCSVRADGTKIYKILSEEPSPNCEQLQLELSDQETVVLASSYNTVLVDNITPIEEIAEMFRGENGTIINLESVFGKPKDSSWNWKLIDTKWTYNYAIYEAGQNCQIFDINTWMDFSDGEQVQLKFLDNRGMLTSYINTSLIYAKDESKVEILGKAFSGQNIKTGSVYKYRSLNK